MDSEFKDFFSVLVSIFSHTLFSLLFRLCLWFMNSDRYRKKAEENIAHDEKLSAAASGGICRANFRAEHKIRREIAHTSTIKKS